MCILLDTYYVYEFMTASHQFGEPERRFFDEHGAQLYVSAVSIWEMRLKYHTRRASGERKSPFDPVDVVAALEGLDITFLTIIERHAARDLEVSLSHKDSFDELLLVQAQEEDLKLLTTDRQIIGHPLVISV